jgi:hypothetical protein
MPEYPVRVKTKLRLPKQKRALACTSANVFSAGYSAQWARPKGHETVAVRDKRFDLESFSPDTGWKPMLVRLRVRTNSGVEVPIGQNTGCP